MDHVLNEQVILKITHTYFFLLWSVVLGDMFGDICLEYNEMEIA